jgi:formylglycine-generating enzyme required for sulfatase activity
MKRLTALFSLPYILIFGMAALPAGHKKEAPPGTVKLKDNLYIDAIPIRNLDYLEFLNFSKTYNWEKFFDRGRSLPGYGLTWDSLSVLFHEFPSDAGFLKQFVPADSMIEIYSKDITHPKGANPFRHREYDNYPVTNISYAQAVKFCEWRTHMVACYIAINCKTADERAKKYFSELTYRLPSKEEWELAIKQFASKIKAGKREFAEGSPLTLASAISTKFIYHPFSIAEMLNEKSKAEGLSYKDISLTDIFTFQNYDGPQPWLGFRCVCEVK